METSTESQLLQFLYACPVGLIECDASGKIGMINPHAMQHLLPLSGDLDPTNLFEILQFHAPELQHMVASVAKPIGRICEGYRIVVRSGPEQKRPESKVLACTIVRLGPDRLMVTLADVSIEIAREQRLHEAEAANAAKSQFLANMSHDIRTPLNGVLGMAQALGLDSLSPSQREKVQTIRDAGNSLLILLNDILDLSKIEAGQYELDSKPFDFEQMITTTCAIFAETAKAKGLHVVFVSRGEAPGLCVGDVNRCGRIVSNLLSNAIKFTNSGEVRVELEFPDQAAVRLRVCDTGVGIDAAELPKLFSKFYQSDSSNTRLFGGSGLGLSICKELSQMMGGDIIVESVFGTGSVFTLELPLKFTAFGKSTNGLEENQKRALQSNFEESLAIAPTPVRASLDEKNILHILAAEDNATNQLILKTLLGVFGVNVVLVNNGIQAVETWENGAFDLILMDIQMPAMDGVTATRRIRTLEEELGRKRTPIIALTANIMTHQLEEYRRAGMDSHVAKPIQLEELCEALEYFQPASNMSIP